MKRIAAAAVLVLLAACTRERATVPDFMAVAGEVLRFAEQDARQNQPGRVADGPLYVNLLSFRNAARSVTGRELEVDSISAALGDPVQAEQLQVLLCDTVGFGGCWVRKYGIWVNWNLASGGAREIEASVRTTSTDRRVHPTHFCDRVWRLRYVKQDGAWALADSTLRRDCRAP